LSLRLKSKVGQNNIKSLFIVLLLVALFIGGKRFFNGSSDPNIPNVTIIDKADGGEENSPKVQTPVRLKGPGSLRLPWPPQREAMKKIIPEYDYLERHLGEIAENDGISGNKKALLKAITQTWNALVGEGGTPLSLIKWEMGRFNMEGIESHKIDSSIKREAHHKFKCLKEGEWIYKLSRPKYEDPFSECWKKISYLTPSILKLVAFWHHTITSLLRACIGFDQFVREQV